MKKIMLAVLFVTANLFYLNNHSVKAEEPGHYLKAIIYFEQAESQKNMGKALPLYEKAIKEAQWGIVHLEGEAQELMRSIIEDSRQKIRVFAEEVMEAKQDREIILGMSKEDVRSLWGKPKEIRNTVTEYGNREQWHYKDESNKYKYVHFEEDVVTAWQE